MFVGTRGYPLRDREENDMAFIDWSALGRQNWDVLVEALLFRMYDRDGNKVTIFNGIGGDGGRDVVVDFADGTKQIFQLKHFPGGSQEDSASAATRSMTPTRPPCSMSQTSGPWSYPKT